jgi:hypothetical protein
MIPSGAAASATFHLDDRLSGRDLVDEVGQSPVTGATSDLNLNHRRHAVLIAPSQEARQPPR